mmetsp:Transcript_51967/g.101775  ORF Transcript_51967/g.101775 Transcript_51967/m.101775 type:complete len:92 (+) Transcript_51967:459-734(+)
MACMLVCLLACADSCPFTSKLGPTGAICLAFLSFFLPSFLASFSPPFLSLSVQHDVDGFYADRKEILVASARPLTDSLTSFEESIHQASFH